MKIVRVLLTGLAAVVVAGAVASASPHVVSALTHHKVPAEVSTSPSESPEPSDSPSAEPTQPPSPSAAVSPADGGSGSITPDFSACVVPGLQNAICRHEALLAVDAGNVGLQKSLAHLQANLTKHEGTAPGRSGDSHGKSGESHGKSGESHGAGHTAA